MSNIYSDTDELTLVEKKTSLDEPCVLVVYNDDHNTFDWVIQCFVEVCSHTEVQAEQLSLLIHFKGKANVKTDHFNVLRPLRRELVDRGLSAVIEKIGEKS